MRLVVLKRAGFSNCPAIALLNLILVKAVFSSLRRDTNSSWDNSLNSCTFILNSFVKVRRNHDALQTWF